MEYTSLVPRPSLRAQRYSFDPYVGSKVKRITLRVEGGPGDEARSIHDSLAVGVWE